MSYSLPPIQKSVSVSWNPEAAFNRFVNEFGQWWPYQGFSIGGERIKRIVFESRAGGLIYEEHNSGRRFQWGRVLEYDPPHRIVFSWHPTKDESNAQNVELRFTPEGSGTHVTLVSSNWERWGKDAKSAHRGYDTGWGYILNVWGRQRTVRTRALGAFFAAFGVIYRIFVSRDKMIARARGEIVMPQRS